MKYSAISANANEMESSTTGNESLKYFQIPNSHVETFWIVEEVMDGDSLKVKHEFTQERPEIRLYGLDAPKFIYPEKCARMKRKQAYLPVYCFNMV